jgi:hypothetical protein
MKRKFILSGIATTIAISALPAMAQFNYHNGDMLAAFGNGGPTDVIVDLGPISNFNGSSIYSWNLNAVLTATFGGVDSGIYWAVFGVNDTSGGGSYAPGQTDPNTIWATLARANASVPTHAPNIFGSSASFQYPLVYIQTIGNTTSPSQAGPGLIVDYAPDIELVDTSLGTFTGVMHDSTSGYNGNFANTWYYNALNNGPGTSDLYLNNPGSHPSTMEGSLILDGAGQFSYVPEPSTWAMLGSGVLTLIALQRRKK